MSGPSALVRTLEAEGTAWTVREARLPAVTAPAGVAALVFDCGVRQRALTPVPAGWAFCGEEALREAWARAAPLHAPGITPAPAA